LHFYEVMLRGGRSLSVNSKQYPDRPNCVIYGK
jgi:hypothetical protein